MTLVSFARTMAAMVAAANPEHAATSGVGELSARDAEILAFERQ